MMKRKKTTTKLTLGIILVFILFIQIANIGSIDAKTENIQNTEVKIQFWTEGIIVSDANISALSSSGIGTEEDPYIIDNLYIDTSDSLAIEFEGVSVSTHYVLRDSYFKGNTYGVYISDNISGKASVINCTVEGALTIGGPNAHYLTIHNNTLRSSQGSNFRPGLKFTNNVIYTTSAYSNHLIRIEDEDNVFKNNIFYGNNSPIYLNEIRNSTFENNVLHNSGFHIYMNDITKTSNNTFENNNINGKPYGFFYNLTGETINGENYGQVYLINSVNTKIQGLTQADTHIGIQVHNCSDITLENIEVSGKNGIEIRETDGLLIQNCVLEGFRAGIEFWTATDVIIQNNRISKFQRGIEFNFVNRVQINNNTILDVTEQGLYFEDNWNIEIMFNIITCDIQTSGSEMVILIGVCENVSIYYNVFISLGNLTAPPVDEWSCTNIMWYNETLEIGNHYSDWNGTGTYAIPGNVGSVDLYPFIDVDGDNLTEYDEVMIYHTSPFEADTDGDGFDDYVEIQEGTDPLNSKDYPGKGRILAIVLGLLFGLGIPAGLAVFYLYKKGIIKLPFLMKK